jgi:hypothetical protein
MLPKLWKYDVDFADGLDLHGLTPKLGFGLRFFPEHPTTTLGMAGGYRRVM